MNSFTAGLLLLGLLLGGGKTPATFVLWSTVALILAFPDIRAEVQNGRLGWKNVAFWGLLACILTSQLASQDPSQSLYGTTQSLVFFMLWISLRKTYRADRVGEFQIGLQVAGGLTALITLFQFLTHRPPYGLIPINPSFNAVWMASLAVVFLSWGLQATSSSKRHLNGVLAFVLMSLVVAGPSRSALIALMFSTFYVLFHQITHKKWIWLGVGLIVLIPLCFPNLVLHRMHISPDGLTTDYRIPIWKVALQAALEHPLSGYGWGNFEMAYHLHAFPVLEDVVRYARTTSFAHNEYLQAAADWGIPAALLLLLMTYAIFRRPVDTNRSRRIPAKAAFGVFVLAAVFNPVWHVPLLVYATLFWASQLLPDAAQQTQHPKAQVLKGCGLALLLMGTVLLLSWFGLRSFWAAQGKWDLIVRWNPKDADAWHAQAQAKTNISEQIPLMAEAVRSSPRRAYLRETYAELLERSQTPEHVHAALHQYTVAYGLAPTRAINPLAIGRLLYLKQQPAAALEWFKEARRLEPYYWESDLWIARCLFALHQRRAAIQILRELPKRRNAILRPESFLRLPERSLYTERILGYDETVVKKELQRYLSAAETL